MLRKVQVLRNWDLRSELFSCCSGGRCKELAYGSQAFIAMLLFDPLMSALSIILKQNSVSIGLFTH